MAKKGKPQERNWISSKSSTKQRYKDYVKAPGDKMQQNSECTLCSDRDETINHIISECRKIAQKEYKTRHDRMGKMIHWESCKKLKFVHTNKWYMHSPESVPEIETHKVLCDFDCDLNQKIRPRNSQQKRKLAE